MPIPQEKASRPAACRPLAARAALTGNQLTARLPNETTDRNKPFPGPKIG
jgi:hypothetical protein